MQLLEVAEGSGTTCCAARLYGMGGHGTSGELGLNANLPHAANGGNTQSRTKPRLETCLSGLLLAKEMAGTTQDLDPGALLSAALGKVTTPAPCARPPRKKSQDVTRHGAQGMPVTKLTLRVGGETLEHFES